MGGLLTRRHVAASAAIGLVLAGGALVGPTTVGAGEARVSASADHECGEEGATILVQIEDNFSTTYDVFIDEVLVDDDVTDSDGGVYEYGPYADGVHNVRVFWNDGEEDILDEDLTVACAPEETTSTTTSTTAPTPTTEPPSAAPVVVAPTYTG